MNDELIALVERASAQTAPWLGQKRQLALRLFDRLAAGAPALLADWQTDPDLGAEQGTSRGVGDLVEQPLLNVAPQFSELLQENLMEKALAWQGNQENAAHLALLNGGASCTSPTEPNARRRSCWPGNIPTPIFTI